MSEPSAVGTAAPGGRPPLRVAINAALLSPTGDYRAAGLHRYLSGLLGALAAREDLALTVWAPGGAPAPGVVAGAERIAWRAAPAGGGAGRRIRWEQTALPAAVGRERPALLHGPAHALPLFCPVPAVVTVHDLSFVRLPRTFPPAQAWYLRAAMRLAAGRARRLIAVSDFTRRELMAVYGLPADRIAVVANGIDAAFRPLLPEQVAAWRAARGLPATFVLAVGTLQPRKNLGVLLEAWPLLRQAMGDQAPDLVIAGAPGWGDTGLGAQARRLGIMDAVRFPGFVPQEDLPYLYNAAAALALPSRYEGFGLPVAEALACALPALVAEGSSLTEVAGEAALSAPPDQPAAWAAGLARLLQDAALREHLKALGPGRAKGFRWERAAAETADVYRLAAGASTSNRYLNPPGSPSTTHT